VGGRLHNLARLGIWAAIIIATLCLFPPFHIRRLASGSNRGDGKPAAVDVARVATEFWNERLTVPAVPPTDARALLEALNLDPGTAGQRYGRRPGIGGPMFYFVSGEGSITSMDRAGVWLDVGVAGPVRAVLQTGPIFGSALRDATGMLNLEDFSSFEFNELGAQLNRLAETRGEPLLHSAAKIGSRVQFLAAGRLSDTGDAPPVLKLAPIWVRVQ
jgi:predicted lipoprotein